MWQNRSECGGIEVIEVIKAIKAIKTKSKNNK